MKPSAPETIFTRAAASLLRLREQGSGTQIRDLTANFLDHIYELCVACGATDLQQSAQLRTFVEATIADVTAVFVLLSAYPGELLLEFQYTWELDEWQQLCRRRSGLQFFLDLYRDTSIAPLISNIEAETADLDQQMHEWGPHEGFLTAAQIDPRIPRSHWWWWEPR
jgi:hypothetical protein